MPKRSTLTLDNNLRILAEPETARDEPGGVGALLRREGLYSYHLTTWRRCQTRRPMIAKPVAQLLANLGVTKSHSHVVARCTASDQWRGLAR